MTREQALDFLYRHWILDPVEALVMWSDEEQNVMAGALEHLLCGFITGADRDYMARAVEKAVEALKIDSPEWTPPVERYRHVKVWSEDFQKLR